MGTLKRKQIEKKLKKICGNFYLTDELLADNVALGTMIRAYLKEQDTLKIIYPKKVKKNYTVDVRSQEAISIARKRDSCMSPWKGERR